MAEKPTQRVTRARQKAAQEGRRRLSAMLSIEGSARYVRLRARFGSETALIEAALRSLEGTNEPDWPATLRQLAAYLEAGSATQDKPAAPRAAPAKAPQAAAEDPKAQAHAKAAARFAKKPAD